MIHLGEGTKERILKAVETAADFSPCLKPGACISFFGQQVESESNIGKMVIIDVEIGDYEIDKNGLHASNCLSERHPDDRLFGIRIGYNVAASLGGVMERVSL